MQKKSSKVFYLHFVYVLETLQNFVVGIVIVSHNIVCVQKFNEGNKNPCLFNS